MLTILGGTFAFLHPGHKQLLNAAVKTGNKVVVGLTSDQYLVENKRYGKVTYEKRKAKVSEYLASLNADFDVVQLDTREGSSETGKDYGCIVVSQETYPKALRINNARKKNGLPEMEIIVVPYVLAEDLFPVSSTRIIEGEVDEDGMRLKPVRISVATGNAMKKRATEEVFSSLMKYITVEIRNKPDGMPDQPFGGVAVEGAMKRAQSSLEDFDYSVGIEAGIFWNKVSDTYVDLHCAAVIDRNGEVTTGLSSGFEIPGAVVRELKRGRTIEEAVESILGKEENISGYGLAGLMSRGMVKRGSLMSEAVRNALVPRMNPKLNTLSGNQKQR